MAEEIDDESELYCQDFSTETDMETFNAQLGEIFQQWDLGGGTNWGKDFEENELFRCGWKVQTATLLLLKKEITVSYYEAQVQDKAVSEEVDGGPHPMYNDLMSLKNNFGPPLDGRNNTELHPLARLYGLRRFVVIHPRNLQTQFLTNRAEFSFFLSSAAVISFEVCSTVPVFVQIHDPKWNFFVGVGTSPALRTDFDLVALEQAPPDCLYLAGLLTMFREKLPAKYLRPATVSVRNTYSMDKLCIRIPMRVPFGGKAATSEEEDVMMMGTSNFTALPSGYFPDSFSELYAIFEWPEIAENMTFDSALNSNFVPEKAPYSSLHLEVHATSYLSSCLRDYRKLSGNAQTLESFVGRNFSGTASAADQPNPLDQLAQPQLPHLRSHTQRRNYAVSKLTHKKLPGPMNENELQQMFCYLFPEMHPEAALFPYVPAAKQEFDPHRVKSAIPDSITCRLSCLLATCNAHFGGKSGMAQLWAAFTRELRFLWDHGLTIPGVAPGFPDTRTCLLHQKLQMLKFCVERRELREFGAKSEEMVIDLVTSDEDNEDEFYDCNNYGEEESSGSGAETSAYTLKPAGRQKRLGNMKLLDCAEPLYVPVTQDPVPKTEDQLHDDAEVMLKLGPGSGLTTQMMCSSLLSDMEAFKAANPKGKMEDFIRWYSPKDWEEEDDHGELVGKLSPRMLAPGNTWQTVWKQAHPVPASRQKRLFDDTNEALKVLQYLETRTIGEIYELTIVPMLHSAILILKDIFSTCAVLDLFSSQINMLLADLCHLSRDIEIIGQTETGTITRSPDPERIIRSIETLEMQFYQYKCFERIFGYPHATDLDFVKQQFRAFLESGDGCTIKLNRNAAAKDGFRAMSDGNRTLISKDYVIRVDGETISSAKGQMGPQFLRAIVTGEKLRLCSAFTENTTFV